jgi:hypothetical protein
MAANVELLSAGSIVVDLFSNVDNLFFRFKAVLQPLLRKASVSGC